MSDEEFDSWLVWKLALPIAALSWLVQSIVVLT